MSTGRDVAEAEAEPAVPRSFRERLWCEAVDGVAVGPAWIEDKGHLLELANGVDAETRRIDEAAAGARRCVYGQLGAVVGGNGGCRSLPENVQCARDDQGRRHE